MNGQFGLHETMHGGGQAAALVDPGVVSSPGKDFGQHRSGHVGKQAQLQEGGQVSGVDVDSEACVCTFDS